MEWFSSDWWRRLADPGGIFEDPNKVGPTTWAQPAQDTYAQLYGAATGATPSAAELQMQQGIGRGQAAARSQAASQPGMASGQAGRLATMTAGDVASRGALEGSTLRAAEQERARQALGNFVSQQQMIEMQAAIEEAKMKQLQQGGFLSAIGGLIGGLV